MTDETKKALQEEVNRVRAIETSELVALRSEVTLLRRERDRFQVALKEIANDGCGIRSVDSGTCLDIGLPPDDSCWCCNARRILAPAHEEA